MIVVTGANGQLGRLVVKGLMEKIQPSKIVAAVRNLEKAQDFRAFAIQIREADYDRPDTLETAFAGAEKLLFISSSEVGQREKQHRAVIDAAKKARIKLLVYTSILRADTSTLALAKEHKDTESYIRASGLPFVFLRNGWYLENQTTALASALEHGVILGAAQEGRFASAARADYAEAAIAILTGEGHENRVYELGGDEPYTLSQLAAEVAKQTGKPVVFQNLPEEEYAKALTGFGIPAPVAKAVADADAEAARGELDNSVHELSDLIGRPTMTLAEAVAIGLKG